MGLRHEFKETSDSLELIYRWYEPYHKIGCLFLFVWDLFSIALYHPELIPLFKGEFVFPKSIFALCIFILLIPVPTYWILLCTMNRTIVRLNASKIVVRNGPLPWNRKNVSIKLTDVKYIWVQEHCPDSTECSSRDLIAMMKNGDAEDIFLNMQSPEDSNIARSRISLWLRKMKRAKPLDNRK